MQPHKSDRVVVGRFGRPHGVKGYIKVHSFTDPKENLCHYKPWYTCKANVWSPVDILDLIVNKHHCLAHIAGYETRETAALLTNQDIAIMRTALPPLQHGEYYWHDIIGLPVENTQGVRLGIVQDIMETGAHDVLVIRKDNKDTLIPYVWERIIVSIDRDLGRILVRWDTE